MFNAVDAVNSLSWQQSARPVLTSFPETRESLIVQVKDPSNRLAWERFVTIYQPVIHRIAVARGLQDADAQDLTQQVLMSAAAAIPRWEKSSPSAKFHHWLRRVTRNAIINAVTRRKCELATGSSSIRDLLAEIQQPEPAAESLFDVEVRRELYAIAAETVRGEVHPDTWRAFELTVVDGVSNADAAATLGKTLGTVYTCRCRVMQKLRAAIEKLEDVSE